MAADADVLIPPSAIRKAHHLMLDLGYDCRHDQGHMAPVFGYPGTYNRWLHYERRYSSPLHIGVDVHWRPVAGSALWTGFNHLWENRQSISLHGHSVATTGAEDTLRIAAGQGELDGWPTLRAAIDMLAASELVPPVRLRQMSNAEPLVGVARRHALEVLKHGNPAWEAGVSHKQIEAWKRQWQVRRWTDFPAQAALRSVLGKWLPARRLTPLEPAHNEMT